MIGPVPDKPKMWVMGGSVGVLIFFIFLMMLAILFRGDVMYPTDDQGLIKFHTDQCERPVSASWMAEVHNTLSNVGYALAGALILLRVKSWAGHLFGLNLIVLAIMSAFYHATLDKNEPQNLDVAWVYAVLLALSLYVAYTHMQARNPFRISKVVLICCGVGWLVLFGLAFLFTNGLITLLAMSLFVVGATATCHLLEKYPTFLNILVPLLLIFAIPLLGYGMKVEFHWDSTWVFIALVALVIIQLVLVMASAPKIDWGTVWWELVLIGGIFAVGAVCRLGDGYHLDNMDRVRRNLLCFPDSFIQPHALWHMIGATALLLAYDLMVQFQRNRTADTCDNTVILPQKSAHLSGE